MCVCVCVRECGCAGVRVWEEVGAAVQECVRRATRGQVRCRVDGAREGGGSEGRPLAWGRCWCVVPHDGHSLPLCRALRV